MKAWIARFLVKTAAVAGLAASLSFGTGLSDALADHCNFFYLHPGPVGGRTGFDAFDPYAPVDLGASLGATISAGHDHGSDE
jgi:hypothetical protein